MSSDGTNRPDAPPEEEWELLLYVAGQSPKSLRAVANLTRFCEEYLAGRYRIQLIDLQECPRLAREDNIVAIPTLVRCQPGPRCKVIGDLSDTGRVRSGIQLTSR
jgi:circadian clock protein KaiB